MTKRTLVAGLVVLVGVLLALRQTIWAGNDDGTSKYPPPVQGRNNTVLVLMGSEHGLSNVHVATTHSLLKNHPSVEVHVVSFPASKPRIDRVAAAVGRHPTFHQLEGRDYKQVIMDTGRTMEDVVQAPGWRGIGQLCSDMQLYIMPWTGPEHYDLYSQMRAVIDRVDPAVVVLDPIFRPAIDAARDANRLHAVVSPNTWADMFASAQPRLQFLWKYPAIGSGFAFPVPWRHVPENIYLVVRFIYSVALMPEVEEKKAFLREKGLKDPINLLAMHREDSPWISMELEGAALPLEYVPRNVTRVGPIVLSSAPAEEQDPELAAWLAKRPTVLVNLGSSVQFTEPQARVMAESLAAVLASQPRLQVLWKLRKWDSPDAYDDSFMAPLERFVAEGRVRIERWLAVDPTAILETGQVVASVHHGGSNVYHEAIVSGVPHLVLPLWVDLYNFAALVEDINVGVWASRKTAPEWSVEELTAALLKVVDGGPASVAMKENARRLAEKARVKQGRDSAAEIVAQLAASGY